MLGPISLSGATEDHFYKNYQQHLLADDLQIRAKKMMACFSETLLPLPNDHLKSAWGELPNHTMDVMPMSFKTDMIFLRAPPSTPVDGTFPVDRGPKSRNTLACNRSDNEGSLLLYETESCPTPSLTTFEILNSDHPDVPNPPGRDPGEGPLDGGTTESLQSSDKASSTSDSDAAPSSQGGSPIPPTKYQELVDGSISEIHTRGIEPFVESLLITAVETIQAATLVPSFVRGIIKQLSRLSYTEAREFSRAVRIGALGMFRRHWNTDGTWIEVASTSINHSYLTIRGVNIAGFIGSLFNVKMISAEDVFLCLFLLLGGEKHFDRLCAIHALLIQANDKLCKSRNLPNLAEFKARLIERDPVSGLYRRASESPALTILQDILDTIDGWMGVQATKRKRYQATMKNRPVPLQAVGPRLRAGL